jgi:hypothetical protein
MIDREHDLSRHAFSLLADLAAAVPVHRLRWSGRLDDLPGLADRIAAGGPASNGRGGP